MLLDSSGLLCYLDAGEPEHDDAVTLFDASTSKVTTSYVLAEFVALATARRLPRKTTLDFVVALMESSEVGVIFVDETLHRKAMTLLRERLDKTWSLCDAVSFEVMRERGITDALTTDHHFEQAGFRRLLHPLILDMANASYASRTASQPTKVGFALGCPRLPVAGRMSNISQQDIAMVKSPSLS
jgi:predicted nucleic acid-binding protein